ncbi:MAG: MerR family transcriptional regulator [Devosia sp.]
MQIGELASRSGLSRDTLRYYEKQGLIRATRRLNGYRHYPEEALFVLAYIGTAQRLGFTLAEISRELPALADEGIPATRIAEILRIKIAALDERITGLMALRDDLSTRLDLACPLVAAS